MAWLILFVAGVFEVGWAIGMKYSHGFTKIIPTALTVLSMLLSVYLLSVAIKQIPIGTAYAVWTGIGIAGTSILGIIIFNEPIEILKVIFISLILIAIVGLKVISN